MAAWRDDLGRRLFLLPAALMRTPRAWVRMSAVTGPALTASTLARRGSAANTVDDDVAVARHDHQGLALRHANRGAAHAPAAGEIPCPKSTSAVGAGAVAAAATAPHVASHVTRAPIMSRDTVIRSPACR
jgi:hypothetical protein